MSDSTVNANADVGDADLSSQQSSTNTQALSSPVDAKTVELLVKRLSQAEGEINALKSGKDKGIARVANDLAKTQAEVDRILELSKSNLNSGQIARELAIDAMLQGSGNVPNTQVDSTVLPDKRPVEPSVSVELDAVIKRLGLDPGDKEIAAIYQKYPNDTLRQISEVVALDLKRQSSVQVEPNPAQLQNLGSGGKLPGKRDLDTIAAEIEELSKYPSKNRKKIDELAAEFDELATKAK